MDTVTISGPERGLFVRYGESNAQAAEARDMWIEAHRAYLRQGFEEGFKILLSGPMQPGDGGVGAALVIAEAPSLAAFIAFSDQDPFVVNGIYSRVRILRWTPTLVQVPGVAMALGSFMKGNPP